MTTTRLITIPMSHFCEKARWALEWHGIDYVEDRHLQGFHWPSSFWHGGSPLVPVLLWDGTVVRDSTRILEALDEAADDERRLYPKEEPLGREVRAREEDFDENLGVASRLLVYEAYIDHPDALLATAAQGCPAWERQVAAATFPVFRFLAGRRLRLTPEHVVRSREVVRATFEEVSRQLDDGRRYLVGDRFTAADLTFACMAAPVVLPREYGIALPRPEDVPTSAKALFDEMRATPAGAFALRLFREHRHRAG